MLLRLLLVRLCPLILLAFCKERKHIKMGVAALIAGYVLALSAAGIRIFQDYYFKSVFYMILSMFPHYLCYGFAGWILIRCIWKAWSDRVWKRIYWWALLSTLLGIIMECYWNPKILHFFTKI